MSTLRKYKGLIRNRDSIIEFLQRVTHYLKNTKEFDEQAVRIRLEKLEQKWDEFEDLQNDLESMEDNEDSIPEHKQLRAEFEDKYFEVRAGLARKLQLNATPGTSTAHTNPIPNVQASVRLPQISLPEFDGNYQNWLPFRDTYVALIDSSAELTDIQKFHYLRASLRGDALKLIDPYSMTEANYRVAWEVLVERFSNNYLLKKRHLNALFEYPRMKKESATVLHELIDCFERNTKILDQLGEKTNGWGVMLVHLMVSKLDEVTQKRWEETVTPDKEPSFGLLVEFLKKQTRVLDAVSVDQHIFSNTPSSSVSKIRPTKVLVNSATESSPPNCFACSEKHWITRCPTFAQLSIDKRLQLTNSKRLCSNCLGRNHLARDCPSKFRCRTCSKKHHSLLHPGFPGSGSNSTPNPTPVADENVNISSAPLATGGTLNSGDSVSSSMALLSSHMAMEQPKSHLFLLTVLLNVKDLHGRIHHARALLDSGSQANLMSENLCELLQLSRREKRVEITGIGRSRSRTAYAVSTIISSRVQDFSTPMDFLVLDRITDDQPSISLSVARWKIPPGMSLADPEFNVSGPIDLVLGAQYFYNFHIRDGGRLQVRKIDDTLPVFVNTVFGWVAAGETKCVDEPSYVSCNVATMEPLDKAIERFWMVEELTTKFPRSQEEEDCEAHFANTFTRDETGRYIVQYPKRMNFSSMIGESKQAAKHRFYQTERRLERDPNLRTQYCDFMSEYIELGHMRCIGEVDDSHLDQGKTVCYLPHHPVFKEASSTTKVRVVFDGSAKTSTNHSLNEALLTGPTIQDELLDLMLRFRKHAIALVADVAKMYRQILVHDDDKPLQRILWRFSPSEPIRVYELQTVTYGLSPSSFLATRVLKQVALDSGQKYQLAANAVQEDFYMDDFLSGANTLEEAILLQKEVQALLAEGGLELRKWSSNNPEVLQNLPTEALGGEKTLHFETEPKIKTLGVGWETASDQLCIEVQPFTTDGNWTKRKIFSAIAKLYDPLGLVSPVVAWAKIQMQHLWLSAVDWDDPISEDVVNKWESFAAQLPLLEGYKVSRFIFASDSISVQFHVFTDASEVGYGACVYARSTDKEGEINIELIAAKSRVAPLKRISLPRLELCAAVLGAKLYAKVSTALRMESIPCWFWSDSTVTLHWIRAPPNTWQTFIGNRFHCWNHVKGTDNPADLVSRGMLPQEFIATAVWRRGPVWLSENEEKWPERPIGTPPEDLLERRKVALIAQQPTEHCFLFYRYSSFNRLVRITALILRFANRCRRKPNNHPDSFVTVEELEDAKTTLTKIAQQEMFTQELQELAQHRFVSNKSSLRLLGPFLDEKGIIRLGGRLEHSSETYRTKHPTLLPKMHPLTRLITRYYHERCMHSGPRMTLATMQQEYWPINGKTVASYVCRKCPQCFRQNPAPINQPVGQLPKPRTTPSRAFTVVGVDYCGPVYIKPAHRRASPRKAFIAVFVCFASKAVHLELVCDLSTEAFIAALRRFIAHHGMPAEIHSDNGTNFQGANNTLVDLYHLLEAKRTREAILNECTTHKIQWHFIPPRAPSFGGLWEAAVKTAKTSLVKTLGSNQLSFEDYATVLSQIEANMNSRPLTTLSDDPTEVDVLTPGNFLIGSPLISLPEPNYTSIPSNRLNHYQQLQKLIQQHWDRWRKEYLTELNRQREKSSAPMDIHVGQIVLVQEDGKPAVSWPLARIEQTHPGADGVVQVVTLRTSSGLYKRPISRVFPLPSDQQPITNSPGT